MERVSLETSNQLREEEEEFVTGQEHRVEEEQGLGRKDLGEAGEQMRALRQELELDVGRNNQGVERSIQTALNRTVKLKLLFSMQQYHVPLKILTVMQPSIVPRSPICCRTVVTVPNFLISTTELSTTVTSVYKFVFS